MIEIDGSYLEGGGQIARTALALSTITQKPFKIDKIRLGRPAPGLKAQHLNCVTSLKQLCNASVEGTSLGSTELTYVPREFKAKNIEIDIGTAGSISLLLQSLLPPAIFANKPLTLTIIGGTEGKWAPPLDYTKEILLPQLKKFCNNIELKLIKRGYYPKGNGKIELSINPKHRKLKFDELLKNLKGEDYNLIEQGHLIQIKGISHASSSLQNARVAERQAESAKSILSKLKVPIDIRTEYDETLSPGSGITLWAIFSKDKDEIDINNPIRIGADALGERGKPSEAIGKEAADNLIKEIGSKAPVDSHLVDQLLPFLALTGGKIKTSEITNHAKTNVYTIEKFLGKVFEINEKENIISIK